MCTINAPWGGLIHDFIVTDKHAVFFLDPAKLLVWRAVLGLKEFSKYFYWDNTQGTTAIIIPIAAPEDEIRIEVDPFRVWHFANAYTDGDEIVVDAFRHTNIDVITDPTLLQSDIPTPQLTRFRLSLRPKKMLQEKLLGKPNALLSSGRLT